MRYINAIKAMKSISITRGRHQNIQKAEILQSVMMVHIKINSRRGSLIYSA